MNDLGDSHSADGDDGFRLVSAAVRGDTAAFESLVRLHQEMVWRVAYRYLGNRDDAEDVAQESFLRLYQSLPNYRPTASIRTYLYCIVSRVCLDFLKKKKVRKLAMEQQSASALAINEADDVVAQERNGRVMNALLELPANQRIVIVLRYFEGLSTKEIGSNLKLTPKAIEGLLSRGRAALEKTLGLDH
jgi:RNA polymerase sigma-70 factor, ECF subfamily